VPAKAGCNSRYINPSTFPTFQFARKEATLMKTLKMNIRTGNVLCGFSLVLKMSRFTLMGAFGQKHRLALVMLTIITTGTPQRSRSILREKANVSWYVYMPVRLGY
jgi:hypothetical protein